MNNTVNTFAGGFIDSVHLWKGKKKCFVRRQRFYDGYIRFTPDFGMCLTNCSFQNRPHDVTLHSTAHANIMKQFLLSN